jgi:ribonuclease HII
MRRAFAQLIAHAPVRPAFALVDALPLDLPTDLFTLPPAHISLAYAQGSPLEELYTSPWGKVISFPHSEEWSYSIAAASIIAKVTRDQLMEQIDPLFPGYYFAEHKGYGTPLHRKQIAAQGRSLAHRISFTTRIGTE